ncbi:MAG: hypothetical protein QXU44_09970 [Candidatus Caldarchaeum sp.]
MINNIAGKPVNIADRGLRYRWGLNRLAAEGTQAGFLDRLQSRIEFYSLIGCHDCERKDRELAGLT